MGVLGLVISIIFGIIFYLMKLGLLGLMVPIILGIIFGIVVLVGLKLRKNY